jgi:hypothetical protein
LCSAFESVGMHETSMAQARAHHEPCSLSASQPPPQDFMDASCSLLSWPVNPLSALDGDLLFQRAGAHFRHLYSQCTALVLQAIH